MNNTTITGTPDSLSPISNIYGNTFTLNNTSNNASNFKYIANLYANGTFLVKEALVPRPSTGVGYYGVYQAVLTEVSYDIQPTVTVPTIAANSLANYYISYGYEYNPGITVSVVPSIITVGTYSYYGWTSSTLLSVNVNDEIYIATQDGNTNGSAIILGLFGSYSFYTDKVFVTSSTAIGTITDLQRINGTSSTYYAFNGTRQYNESTKNFGTDYLFNTGNKFLTNYPQTEDKMIKLDQWETLSFIVNPALIGLTSSYYYKTYDANNTLLNTYTQSYVFGSTSIIRVDLPSGTKNLTVIGVSFTNVDRYTVQFGTSEIRSYKIDTQCSIYTNVRVMFLNPFGAFDYFNFTQDDKKTYKVKRSEYKKELGFTYNIGDRERTLISNTVSEEHTINTNFIPESQYAFMNELTTSLEAFVIDESTSSVYPIMIEDTDYVFKTAYRDQIFNLEVIYSTSYDVNRQHQ